MKDDLKDILSNLHSEVDQETLLRYLQGQLSEQQQHELEKNTLNDDFEADAIEGLQDVRDKKNIALLVEQLNQDLKKKTKKKQANLNKRTLNVDPLVLTTIVLILMLIIVAFYVIFKMSQ